MCGEKETRTPIWQGAVLSPVSLSLGPDTGNTTIAGIRDGYCTQYSMSLLPFPVFNNNHTLSSSWYQFFDPEKMNGLVIRCKSATDITQHGRIMSPRSRPLRHYVTRVRHVSGLTLANRVFAPPTPSTSRLSNIWLFIRKEVDTSSFDNLLV